MPRWLKYSLWILLIVLLTAIPLAMLSEAGSLEGVITDELGPVPGAVVKATNVMTLDVSRTATNSAGHYKFDKLRAGRYSLWITADGHDSIEVPRLIVDHGQEVRQDLQMRRIRPRT